MAPQSMLKLTFLSWSAEDGTTHSEKQVQVSRRHQHTALESHRRRRMKKHQESNISYDGRNSDSCSTHLFSTPNCSPGSRRSLCEAATPASTTTRLVLSLKQSPVASTSPQIVLGEDVIPERVIRRTYDTFKRTDTSYTTRVRPADSLEICDETQPIIR